MRRCTKCKEHKKPTEFHRRHNGPGGRVSWCKTCVNNYRREVRAHHRDRGVNVNGSRKGRPLRFGPWALLRGHDNDGPRDSWRDMEPGVRTTIGAGAPEIELAIGVIDRAFSDLIGGTIGGQATSAEDIATAVAFFEGEDAAMSLADCLLRIEIFGSVRIDAEAVRARARELYPPVAKHREPRARIHVRGAA